MPYSRTARFSALDHTLAAFQGTRIATRKPEPRGFSATRGPQDSPQASHQPGPCSRARQGRVRQRGFISALVGAEIFRPATPAGYGNLRQVRLCVSRNPRRL
jgi:hypothetical protein